MVSIYTLSKKIPPTGKTPVKKIAQELGISLGEAINKVETLQKDKLVTFDGEYVEATQELEDERNAGVKPKYEREYTEKKETKPVDEDNKIKTTLDQQDRINNHKVDPQTVYEYMVLLWENKKCELEKKFKLNKGELLNILVELEKKELVKLKRKNRLFGLKKTTGISLINKEKNEQIRKKYTPTIYEEDYRQIYKTNVECMIQLIERFSPLQISKIAHHFEIKEVKTLLPILEILSDAKIIKLNHHGVNSTVEAASTGTKIYTPQLENTNYAKKQRKKYDIEKDDIRLKAILVEELGEDKYKLCYPVFDKPTKAVMEWVYERAQPETQTNILKERGDFEKVKKLLKKDIEERIKKIIPFIEAHTSSVLISELTNEMHLGKIEYLLRDVNLEEIKVQTKRPVFIKHIQSRQKWVSTNIEITEEELIRYSKAIARETRQQIDSSHPLLDATLHTDDRVNISYPETSGGSIVMTIRIFSKSPWNFVRLIKQKTADAEVMAFLWMAIQYKLSILFSGETGTGKTSFVNAVSMFSEKNDNIISIEDTRELKLPSIFKNWTHQTTKKGDGKNEVTVNELLENALRQRPERIILGEVRTKKDIKSFMQALAMGHPCIGTIHTADLSTTIKRFEDADINASDMQRLHLNVILTEIKSKENTSDNKRRIKEIGEYYESSEKTNAHRVYTLNMAKDEIIKVNEPKRYYEEIMKNVNMTKDEIKKDLDQKREIIQWLVDENVEDIETLGVVIQYYYNNPERIYQAAKAKTNVEEMLK